MKWMTALRLRYSAKLFVSHMLAVFFVSGSVGTFFYFRAMDNLMRSLKSRLRNSAALLSQSIDARTLEPVRSPEDMDQPVYLSTLEQLRRMRRTNPDIAFLFIMRRDAGGTVTFVVDSDETSEQAHPGKLYEEVPPNMEAGFYSSAVDDEVMEDDWGVFLSGYAPLLNGEGTCLLGIDMRADEVRHKLSEMQMTGLVSLLTSILLALLLSLYLSRGLSSRIAIIATQCRRLTAGQFGTHIAGRTFDEFDELAEAFNTLSETLQTTRTELNRSVEQLQAARDGLEVRCSERTRELQEALDRVNALKGLLPICSACKKIRDDQGYWKQVEQFVTEQTGAKFTHGLCPECESHAYRDLLRSPARGPLSGDKSDRPG